MPESGMGFDALGFAPPGDINTVAGRVFGIHGPEGKKTRFVHQFYMGFQRVLGNISQLRYHFGRRLFLQVQGWLAG